MGTLQAPTDENPNETNEMNTENIEKSSESTEVHRFEGKVTPEQEFSASVARKRRNIARKRSESAHRPRDVTPARELLSDKPTTDDEERPKTPERKRKVINNNNKTNGVNGKPPINKANGKVNGETKEIKTDTDIHIEDEKEKEKIVESKEKEEVITKIGKEEVNSDLQSLINKAKRSASNTPREKPARMKKDSKLLLKKRSQSTPRPSTDETGTKDDLEEKKTKLKKEKSKELLAMYGKDTTEEELLEIEEVKKKQAKQVAKEEKKNNDSKELIADFNQAQHLDVESIELQYFVSSSESSVESSESSEGKQSRKTKYSPAAQQYLELRRLERTLSQEEKTKSVSKPKTSRMTFKELRGHWKQFKTDYKKECDKIKSLRNRCLNDIALLLIFCGFGGMIFKFTEGAFENFYKCGVKRVKRDFIEILWRGSHNLREEDWKTLARTKLRDFEEQLHTAHEAGVHSYSGQRSWSFLNGIVYALTVVTTIGYGHMYPTTTTGRALTIVYALIGIPLFLIILTDFGKLFTRSIKFLWAFVRRVYYQGTCRQARKTTAVKEVMKGAQMVYEIATFRRPSQYNIEEAQTEEPPEFPSATQNYPSTVATPHTDTEVPETPAPSNFEIDDEFNLPITVALFILILYIFSGAVVYYYWENWDFFASFYFVFISMSTIGFGDYVPRHPICMIVSIIYLVFGLALMSMCINVVQVKLSDTFRQASAKLGATIGLRVAEEDGSITTVPPPVIEIADVHINNAKQV